MTFFLAGFAAGFLFLFGLKDLMRVPTRGLEHDPKANKP
jgi:allophanate hydrolase subunit 1